MGLSMPKFLTNTYSSLKERCNAIREGWIMIKTVYNVTKSLDGKGNPEDFIDTLKTSDVIPDSYKNIISSIDPETLRNMTKVMMETVNKRGDNPMSSNVKAEVAEIMSKTHGGPFNKSNEKEDLSKKLEATVNQTVDEEPRGMSEEPPENNNTVENQEFIHNDAYKTILEAEKMYKTQSQSSDAPKQPFKDTFTPSRHQTIDPPPPHDERNLPPMKRMLAEQLRMKFGDNWRQKVPRHLFNPDVMKNAPDLGLGLDKQSNQNMVLQMSKIIKDLM